MKSIWLIIIFFCLSSYAIGQTTVHEFNYRNNSFKFNLPNDFRASHLNYTDGDYYTFYRLDTIAKAVTTSLTLHFGSMVKLPHLSNPTTYIVEKESKIQQFGTQIDGRFWRELNLSRDINIYYKDATKEEKVLFDSIIWKFRNQNHGKTLTNTIAYDMQNLYTYSVNILLDSLSEHTEGTFILEGNPAYNVHSKFLVEPVFNAEHKRIFDHKSNLLKECSHLIDRDLIRLNLRPIYVENSRVKLSIILVKSVYKTRKKSDSGIFGDVAWTFIFYLNQQTNSFELEAIEKGMTL